MVDIYLQLLMKGDKAIYPTANKTNNRFDKLINDFITEHVKMIHFDKGDPSKPQLLTPEMKRAQMKSEFLEALKLKEYKEYAEAAIRIIDAEGPKYMKKQQFETLQEEFINTKNKLETLDPNTIDTMAFQELHCISETSREVLVLFAIDFFKESKFSDCLSICTLLILLHPENSNYWLRAAMAAHQNGNMSLAIKNYKSAVEIDSSLLTAHLLEVDCYLKLELYEEAKAEYIIAQDQIAALGSVPENWSDFLAELKSVFA